MTDSDIQKIVEYRSKRDQALQNADIIDNNASVRKSPDVFSFAFSALGADEYQTVKQLLTDACKRNAEHYQTLINEFGRLK